MYKSESKNILNDIIKHSEKCNCNECKKIQNFYSNLHSSSCLCNKCKKNKILFSNKLFKFN